MIQYMYIYIYLYVRVKKYTYIYNMVIDKEDNPYMKHWALLLCNHFLL